jgi:tetratricopeptide (TPR) repeat protein
MAQAHLRGDYEGAHSAAGQIAALSPAKFIEGSLNRAMFALNMNHPKEVVDSLSIIDLFDKRFGEKKEWEMRYLIEGQLATAYLMLGNHKQELKIASQLRKAYPQPLVILLLEVRALAALGRVKDLQKLIEESKTLPPQAGISQGSIMFECGRELRDNGHREAAIQVLNQAVQWFEGRPQAEKAFADNRFDLARTFYALDKWDEAETLFEGLHSEFPDDTQNGVSYYGYLGSIAAQRGNREKALQISQELKDIKTLYLLGFPNYWRAPLSSGIKKTR